MCKNLKKNVKKVQKDGKNREIYRKSVKIL